MSAERQRRADPVLQVDHLGVVFRTREREIRAVEDLTLTVAPGECVGIVGESGAGKSQAFLALMGLLPPNARVEGSARFAGMDLLTMSQAQLDRIRGDRVAMIFQDPLTSLTPHLTVGDQIAEPLIRHRGLARRAAEAAALELLDRVHVNDAARRLRQYPHELSGGMRQRVMIAMALACGPELLIADEPTTALDVTIQAQILSLLAELKREHRMAMILITHDFGVVAGVADRVAVMRHGRVVESGSVHDILKSPTEAYTASLLEAAPKLVVDQEQAADRTVCEPSAELLRVTDLRVHFDVRSGLLAKRRLLRALDGIELTLNPGEALGVVGESGCGKSTLVRSVLKLIQPTSGTVLWAGRALQDVSAGELRSLRRDFQLVFQDPLSSLDPRMTVAQIVAEPLRVHRPQADASEIAAAVTSMLDRVGLHEDLLDRYPNQLSGGQAQRVGIARAMILQPRLLICDEPLSALDVSIQAQILDLLRKLMSETGMSILFVSHNLAVVQQLCHRALVLYLGRMMELAPVRQLFETPLHPYTRGLLAAVPVPDPDIQPLRLQRALPGELPSPLSPPSGCVFRTRCPHATEVCSERTPQWEAGEGSRRVACHRWRELQTATSDAK